MGNRYRGNYGTEANYLTARIARDRKDIHERMKQGEYSSVRKAAIDAGIIHVPAPEDAGLSRLIDAWIKASLEDRQIFLALVDEEIEAAFQGEYKRLFSPRRGMRPYKLKEEYVTIPEIETLIDAGETISEIARKLGVTYRTVARWRVGTSKPNKAIREKLKEFCRSKQSNLHS
jgi:hypothetical protein